MALKHHLMLRLKSIYFLPHAQGFLKAVRLFVSNSNFPCSIDSTLNKSPCATADVQCSHECYLHRQHADHTDNYVSVINDGKLPC